MTHTQIFNKITEDFTNAGIACAQHEAELLMCRIMRLDRTHLILFGDIEALPDREEKVFKLAQERMGGRPLQYILGLTDFMGFDIKVDERVLIPRPETEMLVETAVEEIKARGNKVRVHDLCTGSGVIAGCVAAICPEAVVSGSDISKDALELARYNCDILQPEFPVALYEADLFDCPELEGPFDVILSNPPYIAPEVIETLQTEVKDHEPRIALDGGCEGMDIILKILPEAEKRLKKGGLLLMEIGFDQGEKTRLAAEKTGFERAEILKDLEGHDRLLKAVK